MGDGADPLGVNLRMARTRGIIGRLTPRQHAETVHEREEQALAGDLLIEQARSVATPTRGHQLTRKIRRTALINALSAFLSVPFFPCAARLISDIGNWATLFARPRG